jgi:putative hydroxymethylpyrimidine transport system substrate-binding protein
MAEEPAAEEPAAEEPAAEEPAAPVDPCGGENETGKITIMMDWLAYWSWAALVAANDQGYYAEEGLEVEVIAPPSAAEPLKMLAANQVDFAINYVPALFPARHVGIEVKAVAAHQRNLSASLYWLPDTDISGPEDIRGKTVGATAKLDENAYLDTLLESQGMTRDDITIVDPGWGWATFLLEGKIDVAYGVVTNPASMKGIGGPFDLVRLEYAEFGVPNYPWLLFVSSDPFLEANPAATCRFLRATNRGVQYAYTDQSSMQAIAEKLHSINDGFAVETSLDHAQLMQPDFFDESGQWGSLVVEDWEAARSWLIARGLLPEDSDVQVSDVMSNEYITNALKPTE